MSTPYAVAAKHTVVIIGAGTGGAAVAARLRRAKPDLDIAIIDPSPFHYYQPAWTLVGGGQYAVARTRRPTKAVLPANVAYFQDHVTSFDPDRNQLALGGGNRLGYDFLVVAAGIQLNWDAIEGLSEALGKNGVSSNYRYDLAPYTWDCIQKLRGGVALFTQPPGQIKCAGAPQKALYLAADFLRKRKIQADLRFYTAAGAMFGVPFYSKALDKVIASYGAQAQLGRNLVAVNGPSKTAVFETVVDGQKQREEVAFDFLHAVPPQSAPDFIRNSPLADAAGWLDVDKSTLQHVRYPNIFGLGDCTSTPNSKTAAAVKSQVPVLAGNLLQALGGRQATAQYDGYAACPLTTSAGKVLLAEFCYGGVVSPSLPLDPRVPRRFYWWLKKSFLPFFYWNVLIKGRNLASTHKKRDFPEQLPAIRP
ncbi:NAD(P)/FAD-dependent oxidoreductase [Pollutimonas bauzanensis]|uniref:Sulfide:quinone oxidoreductase n=1 Tax=Pollutimonas bauzanensis TaxID=658167 RepID=A0A1M5WF58_9BURK|nr:FAD/NAD(P)-binding oxidoreductase [Pollutimonas bauzanensis]SHH86122.1 sulfide:quinone oxidoreductase [Pollutimonas bauzanensis]